MFKKTKLKIVLMCGVGLVLVSVVSVVMYWHASRNKTFESHRYFVCPDGYSEGPGLPDEGIQKWCDDNGHGQAQPNIATRDAVPTEWRRVDTGLFFVSLPPGWQYQSWQGNNEDPDIVGELQGDNTRLLLDFGASGSDCRRVGPKNLMITEKINDRDAWITIPQSDTASDGGGVCTSDNDCSAYLLCDLTTSTCGESRELSVCFEGIGEDNRVLIIGGRFNPSQQQTILRIFRSIVFPSGSMEVPIIAEGDIDSKIAALDCFTGIGGVDDEVVIRTDDEYRAYFKERNNLAHCRGASLADLGFTRYSLLGMKRRVAACAVVWGRKVTQDTAGRVMHYEVETHEQGTCEKAVVNSNWILVPAVPLNYSIIFTTVRNLPDGNRSVYSRTIPAFYDAR